MEKIKRESVSGNIRSKCKERGTTITQVLVACGRSTSLSAGWKAGGFPRLDVVMDIAEHLGVSLDELCYGLGNAKAAIISSNQSEWLDIISRIPAERQQMCKDFLKTHAIIPEKYEVPEEGEKIS